MAAHDEFGILVGDETLTTKAEVEALLYYNSTSTAEPNKIVHLDANGKAQVATPVPSDSATTAATKEYVDELEKRMKTMLDNLTSQGGTYRSLIITSSQTLQDPSNGKATVFRVTCVGAGNIYTAQSGATPLQAGGGGETVIAQLAQITWPVAVTIGSAVGASTLFGSYLAAQGGGSNFGGGRDNIWTAKAGMAIRDNSAGTYGGSVFQYRGGGSYYNSVYSSAAPTLVSRPIEAIDSPNYFACTGGANGWCFAVLLGLNYDTGEGEYATGSANSVYSRKQGCIKLEWYE